MRGPKKENDRLEESVSNRDEITDMPDWLNDIVVRMQQSHLTLSIDNLGQLAISNSLKGFLIDIIKLADKDRYPVPNPKFLQEIQKLGVTEIDEIRSVVNIVLNPQNHKITHQSVQYQLNFFPNPPSSIKSSIIFKNSFGLPDPFPNFTGREDVINELKLKLSQTQPTGQNKFLISGTGGIGKTQSAVATAHQLLKSYQVSKGIAGCQSVIWFSAGTDEGVDTQAFMTEQLHRLGEQLGLDPKALKLQDLIQLIYQRLGEKHGPYCVVFDNAHQFLNIKPYLPPSPVGIIVTTRNSVDRDWGPSFKEISMGVFTETEALDYMKKYLSIDHANLYQEDEAKDLAQALGLFPLAITQALAYISTVNIFIREYLAAFRQQKELYLQHPVPQDDHYQDDKNPTSDNYASRPKEPYDPQKATVWAVIQLSLKKISSPHADKILKACANLAPEAPIDLYFLSYWTEKIDECRKAASSLRKYSLIENVSLPNHVRIHQLVQEILKLNFSEEAQRKFLARTTKFLCQHSEKEENSLADEAREKILWPHFLAVLDQIEKQGWEDKSFLQLKAHCQFYLGNFHYVHLRNSLEAVRYYQLALKVYESFQDKERVAVVLSNLGGVTCELGNWGEGKWFLERALAIKEHIFGAEHPEAVGTSSNLGVALLKLGDASGAKALFQRALVINERTYSLEHIEVANALLNLGNAMIDLGDASEAKAFFQRALAIQERNYGLEHSEVAMTLVRLGSAIADLGDASGAKTLFQQALAIQERTYGPKHPLVAITLGNKGEVMRKLGDATGAKALFQQALAIQEHTYGPEHPETARTLGNLGNTLKDLGDPIGAKALIQRAMVIEERTYGPAHPLMANTLENLAAAIADLGDASGAKALYQRALPILERAYGHEHPRVAKILMNLGAAIANLGDASEAKALYQQALVIEERAYGPDHPEVAMTLGNLGNTVRNLGDASGAKALIQRALIIEERVYGPQHPSVAKTLMNLGAAIADLGDASGAKALYQRALPILERAYGPEHPALANTLMNLGNALRNLGDASGAKALYQRALPIFERAYGSEHPALANTLMNLGNAVGDLGNASGAKALYQRALLIQERAYGREHPQVAITRLNLGITSYSLGELSDAFTHFQHCAKVFSLHFGDQNSYTRKAINNLRIFEQHNQQRPSLPPSSVKNIDSIPSQGPHLLREAQRRPTAIQTNTHTNRNKFTQSDKTHSIAFTCAELLNQLLETVVSPNTQQLLTLTQGCFDAELFSQTLALLECIPEDEATPDEFLLRAKCQLCRHEISESRETILICRSLAKDDDTLTKISLLSRQIDLKQQQTTTREEELKSLQSKPALSFRYQIKKVEALLYLRHFTDALILLNEIIGAQPAHSRLTAVCYSYQAQCYFGLERYNEALESCEYSAILKDTENVAELNQKITLAIEIVPKLEKLLSQVQHSSRINCIL